MTCDDRRHEWNSHIRGGWIAVWLVKGSKLSTQDIVRLTGMSKQGVEFMMELLCSGMPITRIDGKWQWIADADRKHLHKKSSGT